MTYMVTITITGLKHNPDMLTMFQTLDLRTHSSTSSMTMRTRGLSLTTIGRKKNEARRDQEETPRP